MALIKIVKKSFIFPWNPKKPEQNAFQTLKHAFTTTLILAYFNPDLETWVKSDALDYIIVTVLSQKHPDKILQPVVFMSKKMLPIKYNYKIYNNKLLAILHAFEEWCPKLAGTPIEDPIYVITDHKNLEYFMTSKDLNEKQAQWAEFLAEFNFRITY